MSRLDGTCEGCGSTLECPTCWEVVDEIRDAVAAERERAVELLIAVLGNYRSPEMELVIVAIRSGLTVDELRARVEGGR